MSKFQKPALITATILLVGGLFIAFGAFAAAQFNLQNLSTTRDWKPVVHTYPLDSKAPYAEIAVKDAAENIRFEATEGTDIEIECWENDRKHFDIAEGESQLTISGAYKPSFSFMSFSLDFLDRTTVVKIPRSYAGALTAELASGNIDIAGFEGLSSLSLTSTSGHITASRTAAQTLTAHSKSGHISLDGVVTDTATADVTSGNIDLSNFTAHIQATLNTMSGATNVSQSEFGSLEANGTSGRLTFEHVETDQLKAHIMSGNISAALVGSPDQYLIATDTKSGTVNAPQGARDAGKSISLSTISGNIDLAFIEKDRAPGAAAPRPSDAPEGIGSAPAAPSDPTS